MRDIAEAAMGQRIFLSLLRLEGWSVKLRNLAVFSEIVLAQASLPSCFLLAQEVKNFRMCYRPGERAFLPWHQVRKKRKEVSIISFVPEKGTPPTPPRTIYDYLFLPVGFEFLNFVLLPRIVKLRPCRCYLNPGISRLQVAPAACDADTQVPQEGLRQKQLRRK